MIAVFGFVLFPQLAMASFPDVSDEYYVKSINWLQGVGVVHGYEDGTFKPLKNVSRAEFLKMLYETKGLNGSEIELPFKDINPNAWYIKYLKEAYNNHVINGYEDGTFKPDNPISVVEAAKIVGNAFFDIDSIYKNTLTPYNCYGVDLSYDSNEWYGKYLSVLSSLCLVPNDGFMEGAFFPDLKMTRQGMAAMIYKAKSSYDNEGEKYSDQLTPKYLTEKASFIKATTETVCLVSQSENLYDESLNKKVKDIYKAYGFNTDDENAMKALSNKYNDDEDVEKTLESSIKTCWTPAATDDFKM